ncbi:MAG: hypothetical protein J2P21_00070 [Chloracidobacterium sp.]|nr:hypothetical protein [Chloracidobacterium sp.]
MTLQEIFQVGIPTNQLLLHPTIDSLIKLLSDLWGGREVVEEIAWEFLQIRQMSDDEVKKQLAYELADDTPQ